MSPEILKFFADFIERELGIVYSDATYFQLSNRLEEVARALGESNVEDLYSRAKSGIQGEFRTVLLDSSTNNETSFFRDLKVFQCVEKIVIPAFLESFAADSKLSVWSAACSSGQESLSLSILFQEWCRRNGRALPFSILATDACTRILARAEAGKYSQLEVQRGLSPELLEKYFTRDDDLRWSPLPAITREISFRHLNLRDPFSFERKFDLIFCRNVLIYQRVEAKIAILRKLTNALAPGGYLVLGAGESLVGLSDDFEQNEAGGVALYRKKGAAKVAA